MADWDIQLEYKDGKSSKYWRAKVEGDEFTVNYGRIGTDGQSKTKDLGDPDEARSEMEKVAASKRKKGYADVASAAAPKRPVIVAAVPEGPQTCTLKSNAAGRKMTVELSSDGANLETKIVETYTSPEDAAAAFARIEAAMRSEGWK